MAERGKEEGEAGYERVEGVEGSTERGWGMEREEEEGVGQELGYFPANSSLSRVTYGSGEFNTGA